VSAREQSSKEHLQQLKAEKNQIEVDLQNKLSSQKKEFERTLEEITQKM